MITAGVCIRGVDVIVCHEFPIDVTSHTHPPHHAHIKKTVLIRTGVCVLCIVLGLIY